MRIIDEKTGLQIDSMIHKGSEDHSIRDASGKKKTKRCIKIQAAVQISNPTLDVAMNTRYIGSARQHPNDRYCQVEGKRRAFDGILNSMHRDQWDKRTRTIVWRIGEVYAGQRAKNTILIDLP